MSFGKNQTIAEADVDPTIEKEFQSMHNEAKKMAALTENLRLQFKNKGKTSVVIDAKRGSQSYER